MSAFQAPSVESTPAIDFRDAVPSLLVKAGGFSLGAAGFFVAGGGLQLLVFFDSSWFLMSAAAMLLTMGAVSILVSPFVVKGRSWASMLAVPAATLMALAAVVWTVWSTAMFFFSPLMLVGTLLACGAALMAPFAVPGSLRATRARNALYA